MVWPILFEPQRRKTYASYVGNIIRPLVWYRHRETSGTVVANSGTLGNTLDGVWTAGAGAVGQTGKLGFNEAYDYDGAASLTTIAANASLQNITAMTMAILCKPDSPGESNVGTFSADNRHQFRISGLNFPLRCFIVSSATAANSVTPDAFVASGVWHWVFCTFDNAGDRLIRFYKGVGGVLTEATYNTQTAMTGTLNNGGGGYIIGNISTAAQTFDGLIDEYFVKDRVLTLAEMQQIALLTA